MQADLFIFQPALRNLEAQNRRRFTLALILSVILHLALIPLIPKIALSPLAEEPSLESQSIMLENLVPRGQVVELSNREESALPPANSQYLSDVNRQVEKESQAQSTDTTLGQQGSASDSAPAKPREQATSRQQRQETVAEDGTVRLDTKLPNEFLARLGGAAPRNYLPNLEIGDNTLLNTREYVNAPFFIRMKQSLERVWNPQAALRNSNRAFRDEFRTVVQIVLNRDGSLALVKLVRSSSVAALDQEAMTAIRKAAPFVNPPADLVEADGKIHIDDFNFIVSQRYGRF